MSEVKIDFQELNADASSDKTQVLHVGIHNAYAEFSIEGLEQIKRMLDEKIPNVRISLIDLNGFFREAESLHLFLIAFPKIRLFLPHESRSMADSLNLFFRDSHAEFICLISADFSIREFDLDFLESKVSREQLFGLVPQLQLHGHSADTGYALEETRNRIELRIKKLVPGDLTLAPYHFSGVFDREKWISLGGLDFHFKNPLVMSLDLCYRAYSMGLSVVMSGIFQGQLREAKRLSQKEKVKFDRDFELFLIKNIHRRHFNWFFGLFFSLLSFRWIWFAQLFLAISKRFQLKKSRVVSDEEISKRFII
jgi:hypothetical protein